MGKVLVQHKGQPAFMEESDFEEKALSYLQRQGKMSLDDFLCVLQRVLNILEHRRIQDWIARWKAVGMITAWQEGGVWWVEPGDEFVQEVCRVFDATVDRVYPCTAEQDAQYCQRVSASAEAPAPSSRRRRERAKADGKLFLE
jgi:hypothetical protein